MQIPTTADHFFAAAPSLYLLKLRLANFVAPAATVRWDETPGTNRYPHLYGNFGAADVVAVREVRRREGQSWTDALKEDDVVGWLV